MIPSVNRMAELLWGSFLFTLSSVSQESEAELLICTLILLNWTLYLPCHHILGRTRFRCALGCADLILGSQLWTTLSGNFTFGALDVVHLTWNGTSCCGMRSDTRPSLLAILLDGDEKFSPEGG